MGSCANPVPPSGGPIDENAPKVVKAESTPNRLTNYIPDKVEITFDEFVILRNPARNVIISPPVDPRPEIYLSGKTVIVDWTDADTLRSNTTYTVNFANAIEDLNEGNALTDFIFAFSTGPTLDSLSWQVEVVDQKGEPQKNATVMLYKDLSDSVVSKQLPYYFAKTNEMGIASLEYMKEGTYKVVALVDDNLTMKYDLPGEAIGFVKDPIHLPEDSASVDGIQVFIQEPKVILSRNPFYQKNKIVFLFTPADTTTRMQAQQADQILAKRWHKDSLFYWPSTANRDSIYFQWTTNDKSETLVAPPLDSMHTISPSPMNTSIEVLGNRGTIKWNSPIEQSGDSTLFSIDTAGTRQYFQWTDHRPLKSQFRIPENIDAGNGKMMILPGQLHSVYKGTNKDTIALSYQATSVDELGQIQLKLTNADSTKHYIGRIVQKDKIVHQNYFKNDTSYTWKIANILPGDYSLHMIVDENKNGKQDGGNYWKQQQAELAVEYTLPKVRANWTLEEEIKLNDAIKSGETE